MAKATAVGNVVVVTSERTLEELKLVKKCRPKALTLYDGDDPVFAISTEGKAGINKYGATFTDEARDGSGKACITVPIAYSGDDVKSFIADELGGALIYINELEAKLPEVIQEIKAEREAVLAQIAVQ